MRHFFLFTLLSITLFSLPKGGLQTHGQDKWVINEIFKHKKGGFFVDLAAADGVFQSNTYLLEKELNWKGICIEANPHLFKKLKQI